MDSNLLESTYTISLKLQHDTQSFTSGLCLSRQGLDILNKRRSHFLHPKEQAYFESLQYPRRQHSYLLGRYCAKHALIAYLNKKVPSDLLIENGVFQQPIVISLDHINLQVSISHTETLGAALAFPEAHPMAIDVESINRDKDHVIRSQLTVNEQRLVSSLSNHASLKLLWTVKEALSKVLKCGLMVPLDVLEVTSIRQQDAFFVSDFKNFLQYQAFSFFLPEHIFSLVYPKKTHLNLDIRIIQQMFAETSL